MSNTHNERYDEIKDLLKKSRILLEQPQINVGKDIEDRIDQDVEEDEEFSDGKEAPDDKIQRYRISGGLLALHGKEKTDTDITSDEKIAFQETMDEFVNEVSDLADFDTLNVYKNSVDWSGRVIDEDLEFIFTVGEDSGVYINGDMVKVDDEFLETINKLQQYYEKFKSKWSKVLSNRKKTNL